MPTKLSIGFSKKIGTPHYGSLGASCSVEVEIDNGCLQGNADMFRRAAQTAFQNCRDAVEDQLAHSKAPTNGTNGVASPSPAYATRNGHHTRVSNRRATTSQVRAIRAIAKQADVDLSGFLKERFQTESPEDLSLPDASRLIDELKNQNHRNGVT
jgi:hypothetical protein